MPNSDHKPFNLLVNNRFSNVGIPEEILVGSAKAAFTMSQQVSVQKGGAVDPMHSSEYDRLMRNLARETNR